MKGRQATTARGTVKKLWDKPERRWYVVCRCVPGMLFRLGPSDSDLTSAMQLAAKAGWIYTVENGWRCPTCAVRDAKQELAKLRKGSEAGTHSEAEQTEATKP